MRINLDTFEKVTYYYLDYQLTEMQVKMLETRYTLELWESRCSRISSAQNRYAEQKLIDWLELYR